MRFQRKQEVLGRQTSRTAKLEISGSSTSANQHRHVTRDSREGTAASLSDSDAVGSSTHPHRRCGGIRGGHRDGAYPVLTIEEAMSDGHGDLEEEEKVLLTTQ